MKDYLPYLPVVIVAALIIYNFSGYCIAFTIIALCIIFYKEILGLCALAQIVVVVVGIPYLFFTDSSAGSTILTLALFFGGIFFLVKIFGSDENNIDSQNSSPKKAIKSEPKILSNSNSNPNPRSSCIKIESLQKYEPTRQENFSYQSEISTGFYRVQELQNRFEKWMISVDNAGTDNKWKYGRDYERYIGYLFERDGFQVIFNGAINGSSDGGIDLFCFKDGIVYPIQCKRWKNKVDDKEIAKFAGAIELFKLNRSAYSIPLCYSKVIPLFYTTGDYTNSAKWEASAKGVVCRVQKFNSIREYPAVKCTIRNGKKIYYLPFDKGFDEISVGVFRGGCHKFSVTEAEQAGYHYHKGLPIKEKTGSRSEDGIYWQGNKNYPYTYFHSGYWEYVDLQSCKIIYRNAVECSFSANFIGVINNVSPKIVKSGVILFRQLKNNDNLPEFYDDERKLWITLPKNRKMLQRECLAEYINATHTFKNNMFYIVYRQLFNRDYVDPR